MLTVNLPSVFAHQWWEKGLHGAALPVSARALAERPGSIHFQGLFSLGNH